MNIISSTRALKATNRKINALQKRRKEAKNRLLWDKKNADELAIAVAHQTKLTELLLNSLAEQGQFNHSGWHNTPEVEAEYHE